MTNALIRASARAMPNSRRPVPKPEDFIENLAALPAQYGLTVAGDCLAPHIRDGQVILVDRTAPYKAGDLVVIFRKREATPGGCFQGIVKRLVTAPPFFVRFPFKDHPESEVQALIMVEQLNPRGRFTIRCADILGIHRCMGIMPADVVQTPSSWPEADRSAAPKLLEAAL